MSEVIEVTEEVVFTEIPAKIAVKIGKRTRYFDTKEDAVAALARFNEGPKTANKGIQEARKKAKAEKEAFEAPVKAYLEGKGYEGRALVQRTRVIAEYLMDQGATDEYIEETTVEPVDPSVDPLADLL